MKILVYGAGGMGSFLAYKLKKSGQAVKIAARNERLNYIRKNGIKIYDRVRKNTEGIYLDAAKKIEGLDEFDLLIIVVQNHQHELVINSLPDNIKIRCVLIVGNNASPLNALKLCRNKFGGNVPVEFGFLNIMAMIKNGTDCCLSAGKPSLTVGFNEKTQNILKQAFEKTNIKLAFEENIYGFLMTHVAFVLPLSYVCYAFNGDIKKAASKKEIMYLMVTAMGEGFSVLEKNGFEVVPSAYKKLAGFKRILMLLMKVMFITPLGDIMIVEHSQICLDEVVYMDKEFNGIIENSNARAWKKLRNIWVKSNG